MEPGIADILGKREPEAKVVRVIWRMQGPSRIISAKIVRHPFGRELVIAFDGDEDVIETRFERTGTAALEQRADALRELLEGKGWVSVRAK